MVIIKSAVEIQKMREAANIAMRAMQAVLSAVQAGITTKKLDAIAFKTITDSGATPSFKGYNGFPGSICTSINDVVVHGIPRDRTLQEGDIIGIDLGAYYHGYHSDMARTIGVGEISDEAKRLIRVTRESFFKGIAKAHAGNRVGEISRAIQEHAENNGMGVVRELVGHGVGQALHESPEVPNFVTRSRGPLLREGMALAIEPMINLGTERVVWDDDGWTVRTCDGKLSAHYENTIIVGKSDCEILTLDDTREG